MSHCVKKDVYKVDICNESLIMEYFLFQRLCWFLQMAINFIRKGERQLMLKLMLNFGKYQMLEIMFKLLVVRFF